MSRLTILVLCLCTLARSISADTFKLRHEASGKVLGPFELAEGRDFMLGKTPMRVEDIVNDRGVRLRHVASEKVLGPFPLQDGAEITLGNTRFFLVDLQRTRRDEDAASVTQGAAVADGGDLVARLNDASLPLIERCAMPRQLLTEAAVRGEREVTAAALKNAVVSVFLGGGLTESQKLQLIGPATDALTALERLGTTPVSPETAAWLFATDGRVRMFADTVSSKDNIDRVLTIVAALRAHDPAGCDAFDKLILAMAVVWDARVRRVHGQGGSQALAFAPELEARYDYFKAVYGSNRGLAFYQKATARTLVFAVATPVPTSELAWARKNVGGTAATWSKKFSDISYDHDRLETGVLVWPHGPYTLESIEKEGGICADQAYYAVMTARAHGIPAIYFSAVGKRGAHGWFAYMKTPTEWQLDSGRYTYDEYVTGFGHDPQTHGKMTDHDVEYTCSRAFKSRQYEEARLLTRVATVLNDRKRYLEGVAAARRARTLVRQFREPWDVEADGLARMGNPAGAAAVMDQKAKMFARYADIAAEARGEQATFLMAAGDAAGADTVLAREVKSVGRERDDLAWALTQQRLAYARKGKDPAAPLDVLEAFMDAQADQGEKTLAWIRSYLSESVDRAGTSNSKLLEDGAEFVEDYVRKVLMQAGTKLDPRPFLRLQLEAQQRAGLERDADKTRERLERVQESIVR